MSRKKVTRHRLDTLRGTDEIQRYLLASMRSLLFGSPTTSWYRLSSTPYTSASASTATAGLTSIERAFVIRSFRTRERPFRHLPRTKIRRIAPKIPQWENCTDELRLLFSAFSFTGGTSYGFTLCLNAKIQAQALSEVNPLDWLRRRVAKHLKERLGHLPEFWLVLERTRDGKLHLHGQLAISVTEYADVRSALKAAGGEWSVSGRGHQLVMYQNPDLGWAGYCAKGFMRRRKYRLPGRVLSMTQGLTRSAAEVCEQFREAWA